MSKRLTTPPDKTVPSSNDSSENPETPKTQTLSQRHQQNLQAITEQMREAIQLAAHPYVERKNGYLAGVMAELKLEGNWNYDEETFTFSEILPAQSQKAQ